MERHSPPTERVARLLDFLAAHPGELYSVSEIARQTGIAKPTCIGIARELARAGYLERDPHTMMYGLGPAFITAGTAVYDSMPSLREVRAAALELSKTRSLACTLSAPGPGYLTIVERVGPPNAFDPLLRTGQRLPMVPPTGKIAVVWQDDASLEGWLARAPRTASSLDLAEFRASVAGIRRQGYHVDGMNDATWTLLERLASFPRDALSDEALSVVAHVQAAFAGPGLPADLEPHGSYAVGTVSAPVYVGEGTLKFVLVLYVAQKDVSADQIEDYGRSVVAAAARATKAIGGKDPWVTHR